MKHRWKNYLLYLSMVLLIGGFAYIILETIKAKNTGFETKTLWDWMELLIIPAVLAGGAILLNRSERALERKIAEDRAKLERDLAADRQQETALQTYFDRMSELLLKEKLQTTEKTEVRDVARTRTLSIMRGLDTKRNNLILQFLYEAKLITDENSIFIRARMDEMDLQDTKLVHANLQGAHLHKANLRNANLAYANLRNAYMKSANLQSTNLKQSNFQSAHLWKANLKKANLVVADFRLASLVDANLSDANLNRANLQGTDLRDANLQGANLRYTNLQDANLEGANLNAVRNITDEQLVLVKSLKGTTMPDGTKHE